MKQIALAFALILLSGLTLTLNAQEVTPEKKEAAQEIANQVKEGQLSKEEAIKQAREQGFSNEQIQQGIQMATDRNYFQQAEQADAGTTEQDQTQEEEVTEEQEQTEEEAEEGEEEERKAGKTSGDQSGKYFGYSIFRGASGKYRPAQIGAADPDYLIGPGDNIIISMWGDVELRNSLTVSKDGTIFINNYGQMVVNGLTLRQLEKKFKRNLSKIYSSLDPESGTPSTHLDVSLGKLKSYTVFITGYARSPGSHQVSSYSTVFSALYSAGGPTINGTLRDIHVIRDNEVIARFDLYDFILTGKKSQEIRVQNNDVIFIPHRLSSITLKGEVNNPSIFEMKEEETLKDLVHYASGIKPNTDLERVQIERIESFEKRNEIEPNRKVLDKDFTSKKDGKITINPVELKDGDIVRVFPLKEPLYSYVNISGSVQRPGRYALKDTTTVTDLIQKAGGLLPEAHRKKADLTRVYPNGNTRHFSLDLTTLPDTFALTSWDKLKVYSIHELHDRKSVTIQGHVLNPGRYRLHDSLHISDLLFKAGGMKDTFYWSQTYQKRADLVRFNEDGLTKRVIPIRLDSVVKRENSSHDLLLKPNDKLKVYNASVTFFSDVVSVAGQVKNSGQFPYKTNMGIHDLLLEAGGFTRQATEFFVEVYRLDQDPAKDDSLSKVHKVKLTQSMLDSFTTKNDFPLEPFDLLVVRKNPEYTMHRNVRILGEVKYPGTYPLLKKNENMCNLIKRAGGFTKEAFIKGLRFYRRDTMPVVGNFEDFDADFSMDAEPCQIILQQGDRIVIPKHPGTVRVTGMVKNPGLVYYRKKWNINDYIEAAGDFQDDAFRRKTVIYFPGGASETRGLLFKPKVIEGSRIHVPLKPDKDQDIDWTSILSEWGSVASTFATIFYIITRAN